MSWIRLSVDHPLHQGQSVPLTEAQAHYLSGVMRQGVGAEIGLFNGRDGEWRARIAALARRGGSADCVALAGPQVMPPDLWLVFAPVRKARTDFIVEKAVELGARRIVPVQTDHTNAERVRRDRLQAHATEAAEQCGATFVPEVNELVPLGRLLGDWPAGRTLIFADETRAGDPAAPADLAPLRGAPGAVLIGPEGGFSDTERLRLRGLPFVRPLRLGPRILRADTAAVAALTLWQADAGDWR